MFTPNSQGNQFQTIPCPDCQTGIPFNPTLLIQGVEFTCPGCGAKIGLAQESKPVVEDAMEKMSKKRQELLKQQEEAKNPKVK